MHITPRKDLIDHSTLNALHLTTTTTDNYALQEAAIRFRMHDLLSKDEHVTSILFTNPYTDDKFCVYDLFIVSGGSEMFLEGKERKKRSDQHSTWMIEHVKAKELEDLSRRYHIPALWMNLNSDGKAFVWSMKAPYWLKDDLCPAKTFEPELGQIKKTTRHYSVRNAQRFSA